MKKKNFFSVFIVLLLLVISVGYAYLNSTLIINGKSNISKNTWDVHFENIKITEGSVTATVEPAISNDITISNFELTLDKPGDFYEFTVDVVNDGSIDAMIDSVLKTPNLTETQQKYLNYIIEYENGEQITTKQLVKSQEFVRLKVRVEFKKDISASDLPQTTEILTLGFTLNYVQADDSVTGINVNNNGVKIVPTAYGLLDEIGTIVTIGTEQFYTIGIDGDNVKLLSAKLITLDENPIQDSNAELSFFSDSARDDADISVYEGSIVEGHVNNYKNYLERKYETKIVEARLITIEELTSDKIGCNQDDKSCSNAPSFIYSTSYWTQSAQSDTRVWAVTTFERLFIGGSSNYTGVRPVIVLSKNDIFVNISPFDNGDINEIGTIVTIGSEQFYTIGTEGDNVKLLSMYNLYVGNETTGYENNEYIIKEIARPNGMQSSNAKGAMEGENGDIFPWIGITAFSTEEKHGTNYTDYHGSNVESYVDNYASLLENKFDVEILDARLISYDELTNPNTFACSEEDYSCLNSPYPWIYSTTYWSGSAEDTVNVWRVHWDGCFDSNGFFYETDSGVRPVIVISKDYFE